MNTGSVNIGSTEQIMLHRTTMRPMDKFNIIFTRLVSMFNYSGCQGNLSN